MSTNPIPSTVTQNILPVQATFNGTQLNSFIGPGGAPFFANIDPIQSGLAITGSTIDSTPIGLISPSTGAFTSISITTGTISSAPVNPTDLVNKYYVDTHGGGGSGVSSFSAGTTGLNPTMASTGDIVLSGILSTANGGTGSSHGINGGTY